MRSQYTGIYVATLTRGIQGHLLSQYSIKDLGDSTEVEELQEEEEGIEVSLTRYNICSLKKDNNFDTAVYKQQCINQTIKHNIAFYTASYPNTLALLKADVVETLIAVLSTSKSSVSKWVFESQERRLHTILY